MYPDPATGTPLKSRFDWYSATIDGVDDERVPAALALAIGGTVTRGKGRNGYAAGWDVLSAEGDLTANVYGRSARLGEVHVSVPGGGCDAAVPVIRALWPDHRVSRVDSAVDFLADFARLDALSLGYASARSLSFRLVTDSNGGATRYLGSPSSEVMVRLYKKTEQLRAAHPERAASIPEGVVRAECQVRPGKRAIKEAVATLEPDDVWGLSEWSAHYAVGLLDLMPIRTATHFRTPSSDERSVFWLGKQYGGLFERLVAEYGAAEAERRLLEALRA